MKIKDLHRIIFCVFWLYYFAFRGILGHIRFLDYLVMLLAIVDIILFILYQRAPLRTLKLTTVLMFPLFVSAIMDPSTYIFSFVTKLYVVALFFALYFKIMRITIVEYICFALPVIITYYYFFNPRPEDYIYLMQDRLAGISEPNFTSLSLLMSMCGFWGIYMIKRDKLLRRLSILGAVMCFVGVIFTLSRAGLVSVVISFSLFIFAERMKLLNFVFISVMISNAIFFSKNIINKLYLLFNRFTPIIHAQASWFNALLEERLYTKYAWQTVHQLGWFIGGGPRVIKEIGFSIPVVPHNSIIDIGVQYGKANFYFYGTLLIVLIVFNIMILLFSFNEKTFADRNITLTSIFFLSLLPMYMFLSAGMTISFIFWMMLGFYPLLHYPPKFWARNIRNNINFIKRKPIST